LEVGTGSGYQAAVLAQLGCSIVSVERHAELADAARILLEELGLARTVRVVSRRRDDVRAAAGDAPCDQRSVSLTAAAPRPIRRVAWQLAGVLGAVSPSATDYPSNGDVSARADALPVAVSNDSETVRARPSSSRRIRAASASSACRSTETIEQPS